MQREFGVALDPVTEVNHCIGSKTALGDAAGVLHQSGRRDADDRAGLSRSPARTRRYYGGEVYKLPLLAENDFFPDLDGIPADIAQEGQAAGAQLSRTARPARRPRPSSTRR